MAVRRQGVRTGSAFRGRRRALLALAGLPAAALAERLGGAAPAGAGRGYLSIDNPVEEHRYLDLSRGPERPAVRERYLDCGASMAELDRAIDYANVLEPEPEVGAINAAIERASRGGRGGVVRPAAAEVLEVGEDPIELRDGVVYDGRNVGVHSIVGGDFAAAVVAFDRRNVAIQHVRTDGNGAGCYGVRLEDTVNALVQFVRTSNHDQNSIATGLRGRGITVRYCELDPGRDDRGNGTFRNQHGIVSSSFEGPGEPAPKGRAGIVYSHGHAWYSNVIRGCDGHSMNAHCANLECMGNWTDGCRSGAKFPHSANVLVHHNRFGGARETTGPDDEPGFVLRVYAARDYDVGVGYASDQLYLFDNVFEANRGLKVRLDTVHGDVYLLGNDWGPPGDVTLRFVAPKGEQEGAGDASVPRGRVLHCGTPGLPSPSISGAEKEDVWVRETDPAVCRAEVGALLARMNAPKDRRWRANLEHSLPELRAAR